MSKETETLEKVDEWWSKAENESETAFALAILMRKDTNLAFRMCGQDYPQLILNDNGTWEFKE